MRDLLYRIRRRWAFMTTPVTELSETQTMDEWFAEYDKAHRVTM